MVYRYKQGSIFTCNALFYVFLEKKQTDFRQTESVDKYIKYKRFFLLFFYISCIILIKQPGSELLGWQSNEISIFQVLFEILESRGN